MLIFVVESVASDKGSQAVKSPLGRESGTLGRSVFSLLLALHVSLSLRLRTCKMGMKTTSAPPTSQGCCVGTL